MELEVIGFITVVLFCIASHGLIKSLATTPDLVRLNEYSYRALRFERGYKIFSWGLLTVVFFVSLTVIFLDGLSIL